MSKVWFDVESRSGRVVTTSADFDAAKRSADILTTRHRNPFTVVRCEVMYEASRPAEEIVERTSRHYDSNGYCDNPARGY